MGGNNEFFENFERTKYLKKLPSMQRDNDHFRCPVPSCKTPKRKVKRLRPMPTKWAEIPPEMKEPIMKDLCKYWKHLGLMHVIYRVSQKK